MKREHQEHDDPLLRTSLQLVGKNSLPSSLMTIAHASEIPWDEAGMQQPTSQSHKENSSANMNEQISFEELSKPDESRWRAHGAAKRKRLLDEDQAKGGRTFQLKFETSVHRYFSVAHWALEQFHELYQSGKDLEETYVMGYRIVSFLTECLPHHPGLRSAPDIRQRARSELELLRKCLEDVALQIDEETCNSFVDDFDPLCVIGGEDDDDDDSVTETSSPSKPVVTPTSSKSLKMKSKMVRFEDWEVFPEDEKDWERHSAESPSAETVGTTGSESVELIDTSYTSSENSPPLRPTEDYETDSDSSEVELNAAFPSFHEHCFYRHVRLDFLEQVAREEVPFETDSDAADSWAQTPEDMYPLAPSSSGVSPTSDPARIAFRDLMNRLPKQTILQNLKTNHALCPGERRNTQLVGTEQYIEDEIQRFLESENDGDATSSVDSCNETLRNSSADAQSTLLLANNSSAFLSSTNFSGSCLKHREESSAFTQYNLQNKPYKSETKEPRKSAFEENFLEDNDWISFDASNSQVVNFFQLD
ncbi:hypothetical protein IV203_013216 [Nitzschia inconspicua]|uniref:Uncharacterized protein n=1 Tax=Nitzschia inconspicua TaxID=303405 RepID=A0A9K3M6N1_9STRA|nr:hypothetical protein IV203_013216 [Nitzschia inconspicua]